MVGHPKELAQSPEDIGRPIIAGMRIRSRDENQMGLKYPRLDSH